MFFSLLSLGLPGGDQVDGLPPAASTDRLPSAKPSLGRHSGEFVKF